MITSFSVYADPIALRRLSSLSKDHTKFQIVEVSERLTFSRWIKDAICQRGKAFAVLANSDIVFDRSLSFLDIVSTNNLFACISRHNHYSLESGPENTQDCWVLHPSNLTINRISNFIDSSNFTLGIPGCDNRFAAIAHESGLSVVNLCDYIMIHHIHRSEIRSYELKSRLHGTYCLVQPATATGRDSEGGLILRSAVKYFSSLEIHGREDSSNPLVRSLRASSNRLG